MPDRDASHRSYWSFDYPTEAHGRIPSFKSVDEEAAFWDTHDVMQYVGQELRTTEITIGGALAEHTGLRVEHPNCADSSATADETGGEDASS